MRYGKSAREALFGARGGCRTELDRGAGLSFRTAGCHPVADCRRLDRFRRGLLDPPRADSRHGDRVGGAGARHEPLGAGLGSSRPRLRVRVAAAFANRRLCSGRPRRHLGRCRRDNGRGEHHRRCHPRTLRTARLHRARSLIFDICRAGRRNRQSRRDRSGCGSASRGGVSGCPAPRL